MYKLLMKVALSRVLGREVEKISKRGVTVYEGSDRGYEERKEE